jgi:Kdo2-lipid IVA lauroyltransferase/acyltransferase
VPGIPTSRYDVKTGLISVEASNVLTVQRCEICSSFLRTLAFSLKPCLEWEMLSPWKRIRYRLEWIGLLVAAKLIPRLSRKSSFHLAQMLGAVMSIFDQHGYRVALNNLEVAFGDKLSEHDRRKIARESFQHFARTAVDFLWSPNLTRENFSRYIELQNLEETARGSEPERGLIVACCHYSNFEWLSLACGFAGLTGTIIAQEFGNSLLHPIFKKLREQSGHELIPRKRGIVRLYKVLRRNGITALLVDLTVRPWQGGVAIDCFGLKKSVPSAHAWLHERTSAPIVPAHCEPLPDGRYRVIFHSKIDNTAGMTHQQIAQACWDAFEPYVRRNPAPWVWMYKHWRYQPANSTRPYPFYANVSQRFEEILLRDQGHSVKGTSSAEIASFE